MQKFYTALTMLITPVLMGASIGGGAFLQPSMQTASVAISSLMPPGGAPPITFRLDLDDSGVSNLPLAMTVNGTAVQPALAFRGHDATATTWADHAGVFSTLTKSDAGETLDVAGPFIDDLNSVTPGGEAYWSHATDTPAIGTDDIVIELVLDVTDNAGGNEFLGGTRQAAPGAPTMYLAAEATKMLLLIWTGASNSNIFSAALPQAWAHVIVFVDRSGFAQWYVNGAASGAAVNVTGNAGSLTNTEPWAIGTTGAGTLPGYTRPIAWVALWHSAAWLDTHLQADVALERFQRLTGTWPEGAKGSKIASAVSRGSATTLAIYDGTSATRLHTVGNNWPSVGCRDAGFDSGGARVCGLSTYTAGTNLALQSSDLATTWTTLNSTIDINRQTDPFGTTTMDDIDGSGAGEHGVTQAVTLTAVAHTMSVWALAGGQTWAYLSDDTVANADAYFDLSSCAAGTSGAAATAIVEDYGGGLCRIAISFTGTVASHTTSWQCAEADLDNSYTGAAADCSFWGAQVEASAYPTSYIATTTTTVSRSGDTLRFVGDNGNVANTQQGIRCATMLLPNSTTGGIDGYWGGLSDGGAAGDRILGMVSSLVSKFDSSATAGSAGAITGSATVSDDGVHQICHSWRTDYVAQCVDGALDGTPDTDVGIPDDIDQIYPAQSPNHSTVAFGVMSNFRIYNSPRTCLAIAAAP